MCIALSLSHRSNWIQDLVSGMASFPSWMARQEQTRFPRALGLPLPPQGGPWSWGSEEAGAGGSRWVLWNSLSPVGAQHQTAVVATPGKALAAYRRPAAQPRAPSCLCLLPFSNPGPEWRSSAREAALRSWRQRRMLIQAASWSTLNPGNRFWMDFQRVCKPDSHYPALQHPP